MWAIVLMAASGFAANYVPQTANIISFSGIPLSTGSGVNNSGVLRVAQVSDISAPVYVQQSSFQVYNVTGSTATFRQDAIYGTGTFTTTASSTAFCGAIFKHFGLQVVQTGTVTSWDVRLEGSLDQSNYDQILQHTNVTGSGDAVWSGTNISPSICWRVRVAGLTLGLGTNIVVSAAGAQ